MLRAELFAPLAIQSREFGQQRGLFFVAGRSEEILDFRRSDLRPGIVEPVREFVDAAEELGRRLG